MKSFFSYAIAFLFIFIALSSQVHGYQKDNANEVHIKGLANNAQNPVKIRTNFSFFNSQKALKLTS